MRTPLWMPLTPVIVAIALAVLLLVRSRLVRHAAKKKALSWIASGSIPSVAACYSVYQVLAKYRSDEECDRILTRLDALSGRRSES